MPAEQIPTSSPEILMHGGWVATAIIGALAWLARLTIGRNLKNWDETLKGFSEKLDSHAEESAKLRDLVATVNARLARIEGRFEQQDHSK